MIVSQSESDAISEIEEAYGGPLSPSARKYLYVHCLADYQTSHLTNQEVVSMLTGIFGPAPSARPHQTAKMENLVSLAENNHAFAVSGILGLRAGNDPEVVTYRNETLGGKLLEKDKIEPWVTRMGRRDGPPTKWLYGIQVPGEHRILSRDGGGVRVKPGLTVEEAQRSMGYQLVFWSAASKELESTFVAAGGVLDSLRLLAERLANEFGWSPDQAVSFVLCGEVPIVEGIVLGAHLYLSHPFRSRMTLEIDPSTSPGDVANAYRSARDEWFDTGRRQSIKRQTLALFYAKHAEYADEKPNRRVLMRIWNTACDSEVNWEEGWKYDEVSGLDNFQRDFRDSYRELVRDRRKPVIKEGED